MGGNAKEVRQGKARWVRYEGKSRTRTKVKRKNRRRRRNMTEECSKEASKEGRNG